MAETANRWRPSSIVLVSGAVLAGAIVALAISGGSGPLTAPKAILLGAVEGVTEFLPVSSTGHLLITERLLDLGSGKGKAAADTFAIAIRSAQSLQSSRCTGSGLCNFSRVSSDAIRMAGTCWSGCV